MERMMDNETFDEVLNSFKEADSIVKRLKTRIAELEKENKNLKLIQETNEKQIQNDIKERDELREENKKLNERIKELEQCNLNLQEWIDNKEKLKEELRIVKELYKANVD